MFQYAYARSLKEKGFDVKLDVNNVPDIGFQLRHYDIDIDIANRNDMVKYKINGIWPKIQTRLGNVNSNILNEETVFYDQNLLSPSDGLYICGYFQSHKYFLNIQDLLISQLSINSKISKYTKTIKKEIEEHSECCSVHVRRGDYFTNKNKKIYGTCTLGYYERAIDVIRRKKSNTRFFIFSDDIQWVRKNIRIDNAAYVYSDEKRLPHEDIYLMSLCDHNIIANSSFSWWGAWLNRNKYKIVIAPKLWLLDKKMNELSQFLIPIDWQRLENADNIINQNSVNNLF